jgi:hypothetical protein
MLTCKMPFGMSNVPEMLQNQISRWLIIPHTLVQLTVFQAYVYIITSCITQRNSFLHFLDNMCGISFFWMRPYTAHKNTNIKIVTDMVFFTHGPYNEWIHIQFQIAKSFLWSL